jgi:dihydroorotate dehydrogenase (NAD+) catalytic subunit
MEGYTLFGTEISGRFTIPSGIVTVTLDTLGRLGREIPELGILTTKSIGPEPRTGNPEPVFAQVDESRFVNAVGLANPGCDALAAELRNFEVPARKFLLVSIFGASPEEFQRVAKTLTPWADGFELNFSCPHARGYGQEIGRDPEVASAYLIAVKGVTPRPVLCKLSPNVGDLRPVAARLIQAGADGFSVINTCGPVECRDPLAASPVLSNVVGGMSGPGIRQEALRSVRQVAAAVRDSGRNLPIIGMGGLASPQDVQEMGAAGASFLGIGTALLGMSTDEMREFFARLAGGEPCPLRLAPEIMKFRRFRVAKTLQPASDLKVFWTEESFSLVPGQFTFVWLPGNREKPFAPAFDDPCALVVRKVGPFTTDLFKLGTGDVFYMRGPYGVGFDIAPDPKPDAYCLVGGGTGIAPLLLLAKRLSAHSPADRIHVFLGGRTSQQVYFLDEFRQFSTLHISTDDGSLGFKGFVTEVLEQFLNEHLSQTWQFYNCGPERMEKAAFAIQRRFRRTGIQTSVERYMKCGVGICGICAMDGLRTCVDGPVLDERALAESRHFGCCRRTKTGSLEPFR